MILLLLLILALTFAYAFYKWNYGYWEKRGVPGPKPLFLFGNVLDAFLMRRGPGEIYTDIYNDYPDSALVGVYRGTTPCVLARDPELIKDIVVRSFSNFHDNDLYVDKELDPIFGRNPFVLKGADWKATRTLLTPCFSSGKMKALYPFIEENCKKLVQFISKEPDAFNGKGLEAKELCTKYTLDNVANCAFGLKGKCFEDPKCEFRELAHRFLTPSTWTSFKFFLLFFIPSAQRILRVKVTPVDVENTLMDMTKTTMKHRKENNIVKNDFIQFISQLKETSDQVTDVDVTAHAASFFGDGYETSSIIMSFVLYRLAENPRAQSILREEVTKAFKENDDNLPYDVMQSLNYLDAVLDESLRLHPPVFALYKTCTSPYTYVSKTNDGLKASSVTIEKDTSVILPVYGLQNDPQYFEDPESFKPERFLPENKNKLVKYTYLPFGEGPRVCLGQRFGTMQIKAGVAYVVRHFEMSVNKKTKRPLKYVPTYPMLSPKGGLWLDFKKIDI